MFRDFDVCVRVRHEKNFPQDTVYCRRWCCSSKNGWTLSSSAGQTWVHILLISNIRPIGTLQWYVKLTCQVFAFYII